ncbi:GrpB family protein [Vagococcus fluvialis]|uniref:GrpB family protein n=1 Tax=Vagococcus fluvialis TaxID=2738 RepID=UPI003B5A34CD
MTLKIEVVPYQSDWIELFQEEKMQLTRVISEENFISLHHIGSTSVPSLSAKPIIDLLLVVKDISKLDLDNEKIASLGYLPRGEFGISGRRYFPKGGDNRTHHLHAFQYDNAYDISRHLLVRDYLRTHAEARKSYANIKIAGAKKYPLNIDGYGDYKDSFVKQLEKDAFIWHWKNQ